MSLVYFIKRFSRFALLIIGLFFSAILISACGGSSSPTGMPGPVEVNTVKVEPATVPAVFENVGVLESSHHVDIRARVLGYLDKIDFIEGQSVHKNQVLFQLDPRPFQAALDSAKAELARQEAELWEAQRLVNRLKPLYEQKAASQRDLDNATARLLSAEASIEGYKAKIREAELNLEYTTIRSPVDGISSRSQFRVGDLVSPNTELTSITVINPIWVNFSISENDILRFAKYEKKGLLKGPENNKFKVELILADGSIYQERGNLDFASPTYQLSTGALLLRATVPNEEGLLKPGQFVRARILGACWEKALMVPQRAVQQGSKEMFVYVINKDNKVEMRPIEPGEWYKDYWLITEGLFPGDQVVVDGVNKIAPGMSVKAKQLELDMTKIDCAPPSVKNDAASVKNKDAKAQ